MGALFVSCVLLAAAAPEAEASAPAPEPADTAADRPQLVVLQIDAIDVDAEQVEIITGRIADVLGRETAFTTLTSKDLERLMDVAAERETMGCDTEECVAELASAMGARYVVYGRVAKVEDLVVLQLSLFDANAAKPINRREVEGDDIRAVLDGTTVAAQSLVTPLTGREVAPAETGWAPGALFWVGGGLGAAGLVGAGALGVWSGFLYYQTQATGGRVPPAARVDAANQLPFGVAFAGVAGALGLVGGGLLAADFFIE